MWMSEALRRTGSAARATTGAVRTGTRKTGGAVHRVTGAAGAGRTGLSTLIELTAASGAGDAFVIVALAGTLLARGLLCYAMAAAVSNPINLLPAAFGVLVLQKAYGVVRASVAPRLLPEQITLVTANARSQLIAVIAAAVAAGLAELVQVLGGAAWVLRVGMVVYLGAMILALRLPDRVDTPPVPGTDATAVPTTGPPAADGRPPRGPDRRTTPGPDYPLNGPGRYARGGDSDPWHGSPEEYAEYADQTIPHHEPDAALPPGSRAANGSGTATGPKRWRTLGRVGPVVGEAMTGNAVLRAFSGYTYFFFAFLLQTEHFGTSKHFALAYLAIAVAAGSIAAMAIGSLLRSRGPQLIMFSVLTIAPAVAAVSAWFFGLVAVIAVAFTAILCASLAKLAQDSIVQREIGDEIRSSTFAVSETINQVANVAGGLAGVLVSILDDGQAGLAIAAALLTVALVLLVAWRRRRVLAQRQRAEDARPTPRSRTMRS